MLVVYNYERVVLFRTPSFDITKATLSTNNAHPLTTLKYIHTLTNYIHISVM